MLRPIGRAHPKSGDTEQVNLKDLESPSPLPGPSLPAVQDGDCGDTLGRASKLLGVEWYWDEDAGKGTWEDPALREGGGIIKRFLAFT